MEEQPGELETPWSSDTRRMLTGQRTRRLASPLSRQVATQAPADCLRLLSLNQLSYKSIESSFPMGGGVSLMFPSFSYMRKHRYY